MGSYSQKQICPFIPSIFRLSVMMKKWPKSVTQKTHFSSKSPLQLFLKIASNFKSKLVPYEDKKTVISSFGESSSRFVILDLILLPDGPLGGCPPRCPWGPRRWFFLHDLYKYDLYVSYFITFSLKKLFFGCLRKITFLGYGCDPDLGEPPKSQA